MLPAPRYLAPRHENSQLEIYCYYNSRRHRRSMIPKMLSSAAPLCFSKFSPALSVASIKPLKTFNSRTRVLPYEGRSNGVAYNANIQKKRFCASVSATGRGRLSARGKFISITAAATSGGGGSVSELDNNVRKLLRAVLWIAEGVYIIWLFLLPYAPGDPVWAISSETINSLIGLSLNFFFILPCLNSVGIHLMEAPVLHPMCEGLFNLVIGWTFMFAPLLYTDKRRERYKGSLDVLWGLQTLLTNTILIPYLAIRLNEADGEPSPRKTSLLGSFMTKNAPIVGLISGLTCLISILWALYGRGDGNFGDLSERWEFLKSYVGTERLAYAFIWDICLYAIFQPWLVGENLQNIQKDKVAIVSFLRFVPVVGQIAYCLFLDVDKET